MERPPRLENTLEWRGVVKTNEVGVDQSTCQKALVGSSRYRRVGRRPGRGSKVVRDPTVIAKVMGRGTTHKRGSSRPVLGLVWATARAALVLRLRGQPLRQAQAQRDPLVIIIEGTRKGA